MSSNTSNGQKPVGGYPVHSDELASVLIALGFRMVKGGVATFLSEENPRSSGGERVWLFEGYANGTSASRVQNCFENCGDGKVRPEAYQKLADLIDGLDKVEEIPNHIRKQLRAVLPALMVEISASAIGLFAETLMGIHKIRPEDVPTYAKVRLSRNEYEIERVDCNT